MPLIKRYRGDTAPDKFVITDSEQNPVDLTGYTFKMTINSTKNPVDVSSQKYSLSGVVVDPINGVVWFSPDAVQADQNPGRYFYDIQMTSPGGAIETIEKGVYKYKQDITKT